MLCDRWVLREVLGDIKWQVGVKRGVRRCQVAGVC